jgi:hypothetical protein
MSWSSRRGASAATGGRPEKRKVGSSILPLTTSLSRLGACKDGDHRATALGLLGSGRCR